MTCERILNAKTEGGRERRHKLRWEDSVENYIKALGERNKKIRNRKTRQNFLRMATGQTAIFPMMMILQMILHRLSSKGMRFTTTFRVQKRKTNYCDVEENKKLLVKNHDVKTYQASEMDLCSRNEPSVPSDRRVEGPQNRSENNGEEKIYDPTGQRKPVPTSQDNHFTDCAFPRMIA